MEQSGEPTVNSRSSGITPTLKSALQIFSLHASTSHRAQLERLSDDVPEVDNMAKWLFFQLTPHACFRAFGGSQRTQGEPTQLKGEQANSTHCCEAPVQAAVGAVLPNNMH